MLSIARNEVVIDDLFVGLCRDHVRFLSPSCRLARVRGGGVGNLPSLGRILSILTPICIPINFTHINKHIS